VRTFYLPARAKIAKIISMSNRDIVMNFVSKLPENTPLEEIARKIEFIAAVRAADEEAAAGKGVPAEEVRGMIDQWVRQ
jgi:hypothetical protein